MQETQEHGRRVIKADLIAQEHNLNERQAAIIFSLMERNELAIHDFEETLQDATRRTIQRDLRKLIEAGLVRPKGATHQLVYQLINKGL